ncbi:hypothetical protein [Klebsiella pneumoniae]|uniref:hypothetical protein n=1 Tax=Klebsiella pneumoniae TaxID=573 RepID=UPI0040557C3A
MQSEGLPIGSCISPILAEIFLDSLEHKIFNSNNSLVKYVKHWFRYVDDVFCLFTGRCRTAAAQRPPPSFSDLAHRFNHTSTHGPAPYRAKVYRGLALRGRGETRVSVPASRSR